LESGETPVKTMRLSLESGETPVKTMRFKYELPRLLESI
jgi:hypothetical protein